MPDSYQETIDRLRGCKKILVTTHVRPDGDALGSTAAMVLGLRKVGIESEVLLLSHLPRKYAFIFNELGVSHIDAENGIPTTFQLDHYDALMGVDTDRIYQALYQNERAERLALQTRAQESLELLVDGRLAVMMVRKKDFQDTKANVPDTENLINIPLQIATVEVALIITEPLDSGPVRISLRSKGQIDVARFAEQFGGGGHARASGLKIPSSLADARNQVVAAMVEQMRISRPGGVKA